MEKEQRFVIVRSVLFGNSFYLKQVTTHNADNWSVIQLHRVFDGKNRITESGTSEPI